MERGGCHCPPFNRYNHMDMLCHQPQEVQQVAPSCIGAGHYKHKGDCCLCRRSACKVTRDSDTTQEEEGEGEMGSAGQAKRKSTYRTRRQRSHFPVNSKLSIVAVNAEARLFISRQFPSLIRIIRADYRTCTGCTLSALRVI